MNQSLNILPAKLSGIFGNRRILYVFLVALYPILIPSVLSASVFIFTDINSHRQVGRTTEYASIDYPIAGSELPKNFTVGGKIKKRIPQNDIYLVTNNDDYFWPKTKLNKTQTDWNYTLSINPGSKFNISVISVNKSGAALIENWFKKGTDTGKYPALSNISGLKKIAQITVEK